MTNGPYWLPEQGLEPVTTRLTVECSTNWSYQGMVEPSGIEPLTSCFARQALSQLSYGPILWCISLLWSCYGPWWTRTTGLTLIRGAL